MQSITVLVCLVGLAMVVTARNLDQEPEPANVEAPGCDFEGQHYNVGQNLDDACRFCWCSPRTMECVEVQCDIPRCPENMVTRVQPGHCCPSCVNV